MDSLRIESALVQRWWMIAVRGAAAILFGILTFVAPAASLMTLIALFGAYALIDGVFAIGAALRSARGGEQWGAVLFEGLCSIAAGLVTFLWPGITALVLLYVIAAWAVVTGVLELVAAIRLRRVIRNEWLLGLGGVLSVVFGVLLFVYPAAGALAVVTWIGAYALVFGALLVALAFRLRAWGRTPHEGTPGQPVHAHA
jgi:uncharacterized membrane protein HdeD (DUF308 family)